jgi:hypothetical protein
MSSLRLQSSSCKRSDCSRERLEHRCHFNTGGVCCGGGSYARVGAHLLLGFEVDDGRREDVVHRRHEGARDAGLLAAALVRAARG